VSIRVPAERLNEALAKIKSEVDNLETDVRSENVSGEDVTAQYTDLQSRRANLEQAESALREILANATETEDVLNVFNQLTQVRGEIEVLKGQIKYYEESSSFSAINVELISQASINPITVAGWQPQGVARDALQALVNTGKGLINILIWFVILVIPVLLVIYLVVRVFIWIIKKLFVRKSKKTTETVVVEAPADPQK
jgi:multidrug efflux pump subunit AcrA (membrane-fusion protein)